MCQVGMGDTRVLRVKKVWQVYGTDHHVLVLSYWWKRVKSGKGKRVGV